MKKEKSSKNKDITTLLVTGRSAFPEIINQIRLAKQEIVVHMFIWREDEIGLNVAEELLEAADRGVSITIEKDRYGLLLEYAEESQRSFFHSPNLIDRIMIKILCLTNNKELLNNHLYTDRNKLYYKLKNHPNVIMIDDIKTKDHSKYYIFDKKIMILGGINIEDKEIYVDLKGRTYYDYMVKIDDENIVTEFLDKKENPHNISNLFRLNTKEPVKCFELKDSFLELINESKKELIIIMAYFAPLKDILTAIYSAMERGVSVKIFISKISNYMDDSNKLTISKLLSKNKELQGNLSIFMTDYMLHAKLIMNEKRIIVGSCNITDKAFTKLSELDVVVGNEDSLFARQVNNSIEELLNNSIQIKDSDEIKFNHIMAFLESIIMK